MFIVNLSVTHNLGSQDRKLKELLKSPKVNFAKTYRAALLEQAWNASTSLEENKKRRFPDLVDEGEPIFLVSNTNELNVRAIIELLREANPTIKFEDNIDLSVKYDPNPIKIAPNVYLCLSYRYRLFKTSNDNPENALSQPPTTMSLIKEIVEKQIKPVRRSKDDMEHQIKTVHQSRNPIHDLKLISQWPGDRKEAEKLGVLKENIYDDSSYFADEHRPLASLSS